MMILAESPTPGSVPAVELTVHIEADLRVGADYRVVAQVDEAGASVDPVVGRFVPPPLESDSGAKPREAAQAELAGAMLFEALFSGTLRRPWARAVEGARQAGGLRLVVRSDAAAARALPWELLYDRVLVRGHVALVDGWSVVRQVGDGPHPAPAPQESPDDLHVAVLVAGDVDFSAAQDVALLSEAWPTGHLRVDTRATADSLTTEFAHVLHLVANGVAGTDGWHSLALAAPDSATDHRTVSGTELADRLRSAAVVPEIVVLASWDTDQVAADLAAVVPSVLGFRGRITDAACTEFLRAFYTALAAGHTVEQAASAGRATLRTGALAAEWALPVLYGTPGQRLVHPSSGPVGTAAPAALPRFPGLESTGSVEEEEPADPVPESLERTIDRKNLQALYARWQPVDRSLWPDLVQQHEARLIGRLADDRPRLVVP